MFYSRRYQHTLITLPYWKSLAQPEKKEREVTLYIKGFLAEGETPEHFEDWMWSHRILMLSPKHRWSGTVYGQVKKHYWPSGRLTRHIPLPMATLATGMLATYRSTRGLRMIAPTAVLMALGVDVGINIGRLIWQYHQANIYAKQRASILRKGLIELRQQYQTVRVVAHSLGCRHVLEALNPNTIKDEETIDPRPDWLHLCAPAASELDVMTSLSAGTSLKGTYLYYTHRDKILSTLFPLLHPKHHTALGAVGIQSGLGTYPGLTTIDVSDAFIWRVHTAYAKRFHVIAYE